MESRICIAPLKTPAAPAPAIARPIIRVVEVGAAAHRIEPSSNSERARMKIDRGGLYL